MAETRAATTAPDLPRAGSTDRNFDWIVRHADGWITTPTENNVVDNVARLHKAWADAGRAGTPEILALAGRHDAEQLKIWEDAGVTEVIFGLPDRAQDDVVAYIGRLASKLDH